jgi:hypothetical protein
VKSNGRRRDPIWNLKPEPPQWALDAGLPAPVNGEVLGEYVERIGLPYWRLVYGLTPRTAVNAHIRLVNMIADSCPDVWRRHLHEWTAERRR